MWAPLRGLCSCHPSVLGACMAAVLGCASSPANTSCPQGLPRSPAAWCCSWSSREALQPPGSGSVLLHTHPSLATSVCLPKGSACLFLARLGHLPELRQLAWALAAALVLCATTSLCLSSLSGGDHSVVLGWRGDAGSSHGTRTHLSLSGSMQGWWHMPEDRGVCS